MSSLPGTQTLPMTNLEAPARATSRRSFLGLSLVGILHCLTLGGIPIGAGDLAAPSTSSPWK
eukprot:10224172-Lingulodinium_polyedra.AAC.1